MMDGPGAVLATSACVLVVTLADTWSVSCSWTAAGEALTQAVVKRLAMATERR